MRLLCAAALGAGAAVLVSCGSSGAGLIPGQDAGPLLRDFQAVEATAKAGNGSCAGTEAALRTTESDYQRLPGSVDAGLHGRLREGISKLRELALEMCAQPLSQTTTGESTSTKRAAPPPTATTETPTTGEPTSTTGTGASTTPGATTPSGTEGGTAPGVGGSEGQAGEGGAGGQGGSGGGQGSSGSDSGEGTKNGGAASGGTGTGVEQ